MKYTLKMNGHDRQRFLTKERAEELAEELWNACPGAHTQVVDEDGNVVCEFES